ncbi:sensor histidine kinase [Aureispira anguillae]|uniref:histidine kinase n=1 Tax=Aureispira anguillae TaxID=2864201 RepID=A0A916DQR3_9BACT|nr:histidine kinase dimerization/phosphoacceptor domain -containing protein [Aureispira anguillae]BDS09776.1 PAS domain S-box protein [Aureispira anguillae]
MIDSNSILNSLDDVVLLIDSDLIFRKYWANDECVLWEPLEQFLNKKIKEVFPCDQELNISKCIEHAFATQKNNQVIYYSKENDKHRCYRVKLNLIHTINNVGKKYMLLIVGDCTVEVEVKEQKRIFEGIVSQDWDAITFANLEGMVQYINPAANRLYGYKEKELIGQHVDIFNSQQEHDTEEIIQTIIDTGVWSGEMVQIRKDKTVFDAFLSVQLIKDSTGKPIGYASHSKDISGRKETAKKLKKIIEERETLLKEIHHRVKNNLQVVTSLLSLQANIIDDKKIKQIFEQSQYRINAMATIHKTLYQSEDFLTIGYGQYMKALAHYLILSIKGDDKNVALSIDAIDVKLNIDTAIPLGLLINEIITNSLKYGLKGDTKGEIYIKLKLLEYPNYLLHIGDNGVGFSNTINSKTTKSLGLKLICNLVRQLKGKITKKSTQKGTHYVIAFQEIV